MAENEGKNKDKSWWKSRKKIKDFMGEKAWHN